MYQFIETIRIENDEIIHLPYHQERMNRTLRHFYPQNELFPLDKELISLPKTGTTLKARIVYCEKGIIETTFSPYHRRNIHTLKLVTNNNIDYTYKSTDRSELIAATQEKGNADEIIIVKNGLLTDTSYSNIALFNGETWVTPKYPLLKGTMRQWLIDSKQIYEADIRPEDLHFFQKVSLINAMMPLGMCEVDIDHILF